jgi:hypothetical protein
MARRRPHFRIGMAGAASQRFSPCKNGIVFVNIHDFLLQSVECPIAFSIQQRHIHSKNTHEAVRFIFLPRGFSATRPGHTGCYVDFIQIIAIFEYFFVDARNF